MRAFLSLAVCALAGLAQAFSIAWPWTGQPVSWLQLAAMAMMIYLLVRVDGGWSPDPSAPRLPRRDADHAKDSSRRRAFRRGFFNGWAFATAWLAGTWWWLYISLHTYGGLPASLTVIAVLALAAGLALYYAIACGLFMAFAPASRVQAAIFFAALWTLAEWARNSLFTGFPWGAVGYAHVDGLLAAYAPWVGVYGVGAIAALTSALIGASIGALIGEYRSLRPAKAARLVVPALALLAVGLAEPLPETASAGKLSVALLQGNIPQDEKFVPGGGMATALDWYGKELSQTPTASLVVTPETALPLLPSQLPPGYLDAISTPYLLGDGAHAAIVGMPLAVDGPAGLRYANGLLGFKPGEKEPYRYTKHHLVPFGEFIPPGFRWFIDLMHIPLGDFARGGVPQPRFDWQGQRIAPDICYEDLFGDEIGAAFANPATAPTVLLNISNIAWFGDSLAIDQHLSISRMRTLEFARPMLRATNTGPTAVIDHLGRVTAALPRLTRGVLRAEVDGRSGITPFAWWVSRFGLWPLWMACLAMVVAVLWNSRRRAS